MSKVWAVLPVIIITLFAIAGSNIRMEVDDYGHAAAVTEYGIIGSVTESYQAWSGRYAHLAFAGVFYAGFGEKAPALLPTLLLSGLGLSLWWALRFWGQNTFLIALTLIVAFLIGLPEVHLWQGFFWSAGGLTYTTPLIFWLVLIGGVKHSWQAVPLAALTFIAAGFNETAAALQIGISAIWFLYRRDLRSFALFSGSLAGLLIIAVAPGNTVRADLLNRSSLPNALLVSLAYSLKFILDQLSKTPLPYLLAFSTGALLQSPKKVCWQMVVVVICATFLLTIATLFPVLYMSTAGPPPRVFITTQFVLIGGFFILGSLLLRARRHHHVLFIVLLVTICLQAFVQISAYLPHLQQYAQAWDNGGQPSLLVCLADLTRPVSTVCP